MLKFGNAPYLECSGRGDKRFSAFYARVQSRGNKSIESLYQAAKIFPDGSTGLDWRQAKGKTPVNIQECRQLYSRLWDDYIAENPQLVPVIKQAAGFSDLFGQQGHACQAEEIWRIKNSLTTQTLQVPCDRLK
jgi:hypothetical protein